MYSTVYLQAALCAVLFGNKFQIPELGEIVEFSMTTFPQVPPLEELFANFEKF